MDKKRNLYLIGYMGTGKTAVATELSALLLRPVLEMDALLAARAGKSIPAIFAEDGEACFRAAETALLKEIATGSFPPAIVSCGGGVPLSSGNRELLKSSGSVILLEASPATLWRRLQGDTSRPLLQDKNSEQDLAAMLAVRMPFYQAAAHLRIPTDGLTPREVAERIRAELETQ